VLRWHQGAVQLLFFKGLYFTSFGGKFPTIWHRLYSFDQATYYLQAIPGYMLLLMPIIYGKLLRLLALIHRTHYVLSTTCLSRCILHCCSVYSVCCTCPIIIALANCFCCSFVAGTFCYSICRHYWRATI
jgi:hypothetical protein